MKTAMMIGVISILAAIGTDLGGSRPGSFHDTSVISATEVDIDGDGQNEVLEVRLVNGCRYVDERLWCGLGDKWEGKFELRVRRGARILANTSLNHLMERETLFFHAPAFDLALHDYNRDGDIDFDLGAYAGCNGAYYYLFTIAPDGKVTRLGGQKHYMFGHANSSCDILLADGLVGFTYYSQSSGIYETTWCQWDGEMFEEVRREPAADSFWNRSCATQ